MFDEVVNVIVISEAVNEEGLSPQRTQIGWHVRIVGNFCISTLKVPNK